MKYTSKNRYDGNKIISEHKDPDIVAGIKHHTIIIIKTSMYSSFL